MARTVQQSSMVLAMLALWLGVAAAQQHRFGPPPTAAALAAGASFPRRLPTDSFPCSADEKACFANNRVLHHKSGKCYRLGSQGPCGEGQQFVALKEPYFASGRIVGECRSAHLCDSRERMRMADGRCYDVADSAYVNWKQCPFDKKQLLKREIFGEGSCCSSQDCLRAQSVAAQPAVPGLCYAPNLDYLLLDDDQPEDVRGPLGGAKMPCSDGDVRCFAVDKLYHRQSDSCYSLFESCGSLGWVVADRKAFDASGALEPVCAQARCPPGRVWVARDQRCRALWELQSTLCAGDDVLFDVFGQAHCARGVSQRALVATSRLLGPGGACQSATARTTPPTSSQAFFPAVQASQATQIAPFPAAAAAQQAPAAAPQQAVFAPAAQAPTASQAVYVQDTQAPAAADDCAADPDKCNYSAQTETDRPTE